MYWTSCPDLVSASRLNDVLAAVIRAHRRSAEAAGPVPELLKTRHALIVSQPFVNLLHLSGCPAILFVFLSSSTAYFLLGHFESPLIPAAAQAQTISLSEFIDILLYVATAPALSKHGVLQRSVNPSILPPALRASHGRETPNLFNVVSWFFFLCIVRTGTWHEMQFSATSQSHQARSLNDCWPI